MWAYVTWMTVAAAVSVTAETPSVAVTLLSAAESVQDGRQLDLGAATFAGLPKPQAGLTFVARRLEGSNRRWFRVEIEARVGDRAVASHRYNLGWRRPGTVIVTDRAIAKGAVISAEDVTQIGFDGARSELFVATLSDAVGMVAKYAIAPGVQLRRSAVRAPLLVRRGDEVKVRFRARTFDVSVAAVALTGGGRGESIRVQNERSRRVFKARVSNRGEAEVIAP